MWKEKLSKLILINRNIEKIDIKFPTGLITRLYIYGSLNKEEYNSLTKLIKIFIKEIKFRINKINKFDNLIFIEIVGKEK